MKRINILFFAAILLGCVACDKHDFIDDLVITGNIGPQSYWEIESSVVPAGSDIPFKAQYYTSVDGVSIDRSEVWYNITENLEKVVACPWTKTFTYSVSQITSSEKRISQKIKTFPHADYALWNDSIHAYYFESSFPVSSTLSSFKWEKPARYDDETFVKYFGEDYKQHFKDSLYNLLKYEDFSSIIMGASLRDNFREFTDSTFDVNSDSWVRHFKWNADSTATPVPDKVTELYRDSISFDQLIQNAGENCYDVTYKRSYRIRAILRVYDDRDVYGTTVAKDIEIN